MHHRRSGASEPERRSSSRAGESPIFQAPAIRDSFCPEAETHHSVAATSHSGVGGEEGWTDKTRLEYIDRNGDAYFFREKPLTQVCPFVLAQECCERLAYYGISPTMKPYLKHSLGITDAKASSMVGYFQGLLYLPPIVSAIISDTWTGTYKTILIFSVIYWCGLGLLALSAADNIGQPWMVYVSLFVLIVIGSGGIKSCVNVLGAQQFHPTLQKTMLTTFFTYFYASINVGSIVGTLVVPQVADSVSYGVAYLIPVGSFMIASIIFVAGRKRYVRMKPQGSPVVSVLKVLFASAKARSFDGSKVSHGGTCEDAVVDDTIALLRLLPVVSCVVPLLMAYNQMTTAFLTQSEKMKSEIFGAHFAPELMQTCDPVGVVLATILLENILFTYLRRIGKMPQVMTRFAIGNFIGALAMLSAFFVELAVKAQERPNTLSIWWQVPQFVCIAVAEIFSISTSYEVAFSLAPTALKTVASACNLLYFSISGLVSGLLFVAFQGWMPDFKESDPSSYQDAHYDYYFLVLMGVCLAGVVLSFALRPYFRRITSTQKHVLPEDGDDTDGAPNTRATALEERTVLVGTPPPKVEA